jgi:hypothetical protein
MSITSTSRKFDDISTNFRKRESWYIASFNGINYKKFSYAVEFLSSMLFLLINATERRNEVSDSHIMAYEKQ